MEKIPYTDPHIITTEDLEYAYYRGYVDGLKRALSEISKEEAKDGKNSTSDL